MSSPTAAEKRVWVARESVDSKHIEELVHAMARAAGSIPGELVSLVGAGAILACVQSMETMNVAKTTFGFEGLGDDEYSFEFVGLEVVIEPSPSPAPTRTRSRPAI